MTHGTPGEYQRTTTTKTEAVTVSVAVFVTIGNETI